MRANAEKVIQGLRCCIKQADNDIFCKDIGCPYYEKSDHVRLLCWTKLNRDALELLESEKPVADYTTHAYPIFSCRECGYMIEQWKYCPVCGKPINWEGIKDR